MINKKVVIGMSGGVDSSTSAYILKNLGYDVYGVTLSFAPDSKNDDFEDAKKICNLLKIPHTIIDMSERFQKEVIDYFINEYNVGMTPSPCVICDERVKFYLLDRYAKEIGADFISTGHYAKVEFSTEFDTFLLKVAKDRKKDQSYMLYRLNPKILKKLLFPLNDYSKVEVREIAHSLGVMVHDKKDSQGICFAKEGYIDFLKIHLKDKIQEGNFIFSNGEVVGKHQGYQLYTIGQRRGLGLTLPRAYFITDINPHKNEITLGEYSELQKESIEFIQPHFSVPPHKLLGKRLIARPRFSSLGLEGSLQIISSEDKERYIFNFLTPTPQNAPGQHIVLYYEDFVVGGGKIIF